MKKSLKFSLVGVGLLAGVLALSGCTANFSTSLEKARIASAFESGASVFYEESEISELDQTKCEKIADHIYQFIDMDEESDTNTVNSTLKSINLTVVNNGGYLPSLEYFKELDKNVFLEALEASGLQPADYSKDAFKNVLNENAYIKFYAGKDMWKGFDARVTSLRSKLGVTECPSVNYLDAYKSKINSIVSSYRSTITTIPGNYGHYGDQGISVEMEKTTWGYAWTQGGYLIEGLVVFPVVWMLDQFANLFAGRNVANYTNGVPQILSLLVVTIIVRLFLFLVTIKSTLSQQKMTSLQPELAKIQQKYPNSNTNQSQKQRLAEEQMRLYKKHGVNPLSSILVLIVQFPIFIGVWGAMTGSAVLSTGTFCKLDLSQSIWECLKLGPKGHAGWWTALVLILLMSAGQFFSMKVPQWLQKARTKKVSRLTKNPAEKSQNRTANIISYVMLIMIIFMGFTLPAAMGVYWFIGAIVSLVQSLIMQVVSAKKRNK